MVSAYECVKSPMGIHDDSDKAWTNFKNSDVEILQVLSLGDWHKNPEYEKYQVIRKFKGQKHWSVGYDVYKKGSVDWS